ncbi:hypothetical protein BD410DRAFT_828063 [Rickenella mellea]|uniref:P-loop containing nucleoside triphosphate hydrolase protein n=1 Tax=Rickenella mellea TaxID=50990 RepID=A0A4Y7Q5S5_9AGAM|nr:hypothetical protein BD410DRAFT_828063 [Rickenella mellea]
MDVVIRIVDCSDRSLLQESVFELDFLANQMGVTEDAPLLILANKQDMTNALSVQDVLLAVKDACNGRLRNIRDAIARGQNPPSALSAELSQTDTEKKLASFVSRAEEDSPPSEFLRQFHEYDLPSWDHYTNIRLMYLILVIHGRQKGPGERQMVHFGIQRMPTAPPQLDTAIEKDVKADDASMITLRNPVDECVLVKDSEASVTTLAEPYASNEGDLDFRRFLLLIHTRWTAICGPITIRKMP